MKSIREIYKKPLMILLDQARKIHQENFPMDRIQISSLLSIKTGGCPEDCAYCPQSAHYKTSVQKEPLMAVPDVVNAAKEAQACGATRFCMGAAWREVKDGLEFDRVLEMVRAVNDLGMQTCCTLGMITPSQAKRLREAGLYAYNHNIDTSRPHYEKIITTRKYEDRLETLQNVRDAGITVCTGGILGMGESDEDRISFLETLAGLSPHPESVTVNALVPIEGTPLADQEPLSIFVWVRVIATARIAMPRSMIRLSAGRLSLSNEGQVLCFYAGANSIFAGDRLLTSPNPSIDADRRLLAELGLG